MNSQTATETPARDEHGRFVSAQEDRTLSHGTPAAPLMGLPIKRWIPQDVHSVMDYVDGLTALTGYFLPEHELKDGAGACWASLALGASVIGTSLMTDYRLSLMKILPIRAHETADYLWGASAIALPFLLGYWKTSPRTAFTHIAVGAGALVASLFTDYRAYRGSRDSEPSTNGRRGRRGRRANDE